MAHEVRIGGRTYFAQDFTVSEDATPLGAGDTTGSVGQVTFTIPTADRYLDPTSTLATHGYGILLDQPFELLSDEWGFISGTIANASLNSGLINVTGVPKLGTLNAYNIRTQPYVGTLGGLFTYYCTRVGVDEANVYVEPQLANRPIVAPGWQGEMWFHMKQLAAAQTAEIALVGGQITLRRVRQREAAKGYATTAPRDMPLPTLARSVEVYHYNHRAIENELVYPPGGWKTDTEVFNVNAGERTTYTLELSASVSSIIQPQAVLSVAKDLKTESVYTVVANDGLPVDPDMWADRGGRLVVTINRDTRSLTLRLTGARNIPTADGTAATNFQIALASGEGSPAYSTLRILGTGVAFNKKKVTIPTGVHPRKAGTDVGVTIDNIFISSLNQAYGTGTIAAAEFAGIMPESSGDIISVTGASGQTFGNVNGTRVWDPETRRYMRIKSATVKPSGISYQAEDDLTHSDVQSQYEGLTYAQVQARIGNLTYSTDSLTGLKDG